MMSQELQIADCKLLIVGVNFSRSAQNLQPSDLQFAFCNYQFAITMMRF